MLHKNLDKLGAFASAICFCHCLLSPVIISVLPLIGLACLTDHRIEMTFISLSGLLAMTSLCWGIKKHRRFSVLAVAAAGFGLFAIGHMLEGQTIGVIGACSGGLLICGSHLINFRLCQTCQSCD